MAFDRTKLERLSGGAQKHFGYKTADTIATVTGAGYFNSIAAELDQFDLITVVSETGGVPKVDNIAITSASRAAAVTTTATEGVTAT